MLKSIENKQISICFLGKFNLCLVLATLLIHIGFVLGQKITLFEYRQDDSETTCTHGLVSGVDTVVFKSQVDYSQDPTMKYVHIYIHKRFDQIPLLYEDVNIQECVTVENILCDRVGSFIINITIRILASEDLNDAFIIAKIITSKFKEISSSEHAFPEIMEGRNASGFLFVNGKEFSTNSTSCDINDNEPILNITFICQSYLTPCLIEITATGVVNSLNKWYHAVYILKERPEEFNLTIKYASCSLILELYNVITCRIHREDRPSNVKYWPIIASISVLTMILITVFLISRKFKYVFVKLNCKSPKTTGVADEPIDLGKPLLAQSSNEPTIITSRNLKDFKCDKNPGHPKFYSLSDCLSDYIHKDYQDDEIVKLIECVADLTTRVCVKFTSEHRPTEEQDANGIKLKYTIQDKTAHRYKTGLVINVQKYSDDASKCPCEKCKNKSVRRRPCGKVFVLTANTVVFDISEAVESSFDLFYDSDTSKVCTLQGKRISENDQSEGWCVVECVTCDVELLDTLYRMQIKCQDQMNKVNNKYTIQGHTHTFTFIVSHPHGFHKHVTVGYWKKRVLVSTDDYNEYTRYEYITRTCPGSAGAFVYIIGVSDLSEKRYHVHLSCEAERCNYSNVGQEKKRHEQN